ncbi:MAG: hypothetical protein V4564_13655 [Pseudomonadota bacterium]|uniref:hypothetical protein n=1 Tax=Sphingomonas sp. ERG5 TaxID=1381597 RepID=UPI00126A6631|nr:hypothetical protein [Sphingomonas sp. ERG5]
MLTIVTAFAFTACSASPAQEKPRMTNEKTQGNTTAILHRIGLELPPAARIEFAEEKSGQDDSARLVAVMPIGDWKALLKRLPMPETDQSPFEAEANFHLGADHGQWTPGTAKGLETVQLSWRDGTESLNLGIAPAGQGEVRLFVYWYQL